MKIITIVIGAALCLTGCSHAKMKADMSMKDSIALADGNKVLGNITFGISEEEFEIQKKLFLESQNDTIYNAWVPDIRGEFTEDDKLYSVIFLSGFTDKELDYQPFREFVNTKFGMPSFQKNLWVVGDRRIELLFYDTVNIYGELRKSALRNRGIYVPKDTETENEIIKNYHAMVISSISLQNVAEMQKQKRDQLLYQRFEEQRKQERENMKKDLKNL